MDCYKNFVFTKDCRATIYVRSRNTRNGFAHDVCVPELGIKATCHYLNRTWELFNGESVIHKAFVSYLENKEGLKGKKNKEKFDKRYATLTARLTKWHDDGKCKYISSENDIFG